ncbi:MAG: YihY/virulence factor BrkB family protein [Lunatimonas sp.]|uniref:YihY/virulence factor BrkB family protein n=1 Tax=Lunatimonas sp. TaxID=2060141 RepID=UPI00263A8C22|nr:YihY/virulence factor BrkB family protein [Lunatimonas sp.]MCC5936282.1 YihY/virulence factor BrkB family protein [Lunatimonas sp.]
MRKPLHDIAVKLHQQAIKLRTVHFGNPDQNVYDVGKIFLRQLQKDEIFERASAMAFNFTIALFPLILFLLNVIPYVQFFVAAVTTENILLFIQEFMPISLYQEAEATIMDIVSKPRQSLLSLGFFLALYLATNGVISLMNAFNAVYKTKESRGFFYTRAIAVSIIMVLVLSICVAVLVMIIGSGMLYRLSTYEFVNNTLYYYSLSTLKFLVLLLLFLIATAYIFRFAPVVHDKWRFFSTGSIVAALLINLSFYAFTFYLNNFASYNKLYGSIGTMIALMLWLWITSIIILVGFEINVSLDKAANRRKRRIPRI